MRGVNIDTRPRRIGRRKPGPLAAAQNGTSTNWRMWRQADGPVSDRLLVLLWVLALAIAAAYVVLFVVHLHRNLTEIAWNPDYSSAFTLPETLVLTGARGNTVISSSGQWLSVLFGLATARLPLHRQLWEILPTLLFVATALIVGWSVSRLAGRRAGALAVLIAVVASPLALAFFMAPNAHNAVYPCTALLGAYILWLAHGDGRRPVVAWAVPPLAGVVAGICLASDLLLVPAAIVPLAGAGLVASVQPGRRGRVLAVSVLATVAVALAVSSLTSSIMRSLGYLKLPTPARAVPLAELPERATLLFKGLKALFNGYLGGASAPGTLHPELGLASDVVMSIALLALLVLGVGAIARLARSAARRRNAQTPDELARSLHIVYWVASAAAACGAFWIAGETGGGTNLHESYYGTVVFSVAGVIPLTLSHGRASRLLVLAGSSIFLLASLVGLTENYINRAGPFAAQVANVTRIARASHVPVGYGGYEASSLTWITHGRVTVRPVMTCENPNGASICPFYLMSTPAWYVPRERHSFLLVANGEIWVSSLPSDLGKPVATHRLGTMTMYIYPYDIASRLGPQQD
jgi:hypothetical protein